ncbi:transferase family hexapeptide repeat protein [Enterobacillus tribolii]|uniref:Transferase family hexapeptide repeat protein n=2 Tax=Enterobacillus tribolii TaxID=1487935 RepID=A0A370R431_9GAMM|nr:transferase family hexapeptide repeat protein [Enterobacillus tribolii]
MYGGVGGMEIRQSGIRDVTCGNNVVVYEPANIYGCTLYDEVFVGPFVEIQRHCVIGRGTRIQSHSFLCEYVTVGERCFIGHNVTFANDLFKRGGPDADAANWLRIRIGHDVTVGSGAVILTDFVCDGAVIGAGSVVVKPVTVRGVYAGNPARLLRTL